MKAPRSTSQVHPASQVIRPASLLPAVSACLTRMARAAGVQGLVHDSSACRGTVSIEFALIAAFFLIPMILGMADFTVVLRTQARLDGALASANLRAYSETGTTPNTSAVAAAAQAGYGAAGLTVTGPTISHYCITVSPAGTMAGGTAANAGTVCGGNETLATYMTIGLATSVALPVGLPGYGSVYPLSISSTVRID